MAEGMLSRYVSDLQKVEKEFQSGDRNVLEYILGTGYYGVAAPVERAIEAVTPDLGVGRFIGEQLQKTGIPQYIEENVPADVRRGIGEATGLLGAVPAVSALRKVTPGSLKETTQRLIQNMPNDLRFSEKVQFYMPKTTAEAMVKEKMPDLTGPALQAEVRKVQELSRMKAQGKGLAKGITNFIKQSFSPQGMAEWNQRGVSRTLTDIMRKEGPLTREQWGQAAWENLTSRQYNNLRPVLKQLDNEFFTFQGIMSERDFKAFSRLPDADAGAFLRTILVNQGVKPQNAKDVILVGRQPTGRGMSGSLNTDALNMTPVARKLPSVFKLESPFGSADDFLKAYDTGFAARSSKTSRKLNPITPEQRLQIRQAFAFYPKLSKISDPTELKSALEKALKTEQLESFGVDQVIKDAARGSKRKGFDTNDELAAAIEKEFAGTGIKVIRNTQQKNDPDVYMVSSFTSDAYELGGVNVVYRVSKDGKLTAVVNDKNDIGISGKGIDVSAPGAKKLIVVTPPVTKDLLDVDQKVDYTPPPESRALQSIREELQTPATAGAREYYDIFGAPASATMLGLGSAEEPEADIVINLPKP